VCAPTRCCLLTGKHSGHTSIRVNGGGTPLRADEPTIASILKPLGYATGGFGKWGCGGRDSTGVPEKHGFDTFLGYYDQVHAHSYFPPYLIRNSEEVTLAGNHGGSQGQTYSQYVIHEAAMKFIRENGSSGRSFFAYLPYTPPHGNFDIPDSDPTWAIYKDKPWSEPARRYAAMVGMVDRQVGEVLTLLKELNIDQNTLVLFSGDNGGADYFVSREFPRGVHSANRNPQTGVEYRGQKGNLYEGGLRIPFVAHWPGKIAAGSVSDHLGYFPDVLPTIAELTGAKVPSDIDGLSLVPTLLGEQAAGRAQPQHEYLYWELGAWTAIRQGDWRAVRSKPNATWELYNVATDPGESNNLATSNPQILSKLESLAEKAHSPAVEGTFSRTDRHERDRRAKTGQHDNLDAPDPLTGKKKQTAKAAVMPTKGLLSQKEWTLVRFSSENSGNAKLAANAIDGDPSTWWHSRFSGEPALPPHELVIDLGAERTIRGFVYLARQDNGWNGAIKDVEFAISSSPDKFEETVLKTQFEKSKKPQSVECPPARGRYVLMRATSEHSNSTFASCAELGIIGE
ncbi:MAG: sulfatase-like hydrolase/transferase, partial [Planctomycetaceae bacterium]|nr:sulfatase-like hydrolase/transferase [Planctomycetaceae bacterium]